MGGGGAWDEDGGWDNNGGWECDADPSVMPGLGPGIHVLLYDTAIKKDVDGRDKPGHDEERERTSGP